MKKLTNFFGKINKNLFLSEYWKLTKCDVLLYCHDNDRGLNLNKKAYSPLIDSVRDELIKKGLKCSSISAPWSNLGFEKTHGNSCVLNRLFLICRVINLILEILKIKKINPYDFIFNKTEPKVVIGIGLPSDLCISSKSNNILDVELLHGIGYTFVPWGWSSKAKEMLPSVILALDDISEDTFKQLETKGVVVKKVQHPFLKRFFAKKADIPTEWTYDKFVNTSKKNILVSLTWGYAGDHGSMDCFSGILPNGLFYDDLELIIAKRKDIIWHFRFHPVQMRSDVGKSQMEFMRNFEKKYPNIIWKESSLVPLPSIARFCDGNITMSSMSCYDVASLGLKSLVLCPTTRGNGIYGKYFQDLVDEGYVVKHKFDIDFVENWVDEAFRIAPRLSGLHEYEPIEAVLDLILSRHNKFPRSIYDCNNRL